VPKKNQWTAASKATSRASISRASDSASAWWPREATATSAPSLAVPLAPGYSTVQIRTSAVAAWSILRDAPGGHTFPE
jgi:hypothetical protein